VEALLRKRPAPTGGEPGPKRKQTRSTRAAENEEEGGGGELEQIYGEGA
jgi:hypothetical protein